jgi:hypothetical protein
MPSFPAELCQHIKVNGHRCGSPALRDQKFCYFHRCCGSLQIDVSISAAYPAAPFFLPVLEDAASIQWGITQVCEHLLNRRLDAKKAGVLLYAMQIASSNLPRLQEDKSKMEKSNEEKSQENQENQENITPHEPTEENNPANWTKLF